MLNQSANYALRACLFLAGHEGAQSAEVIARALGVPRNYLGKVLHLLVRAHVLTSTRGPHGGFMLADAAGKIVLESVIAPFQELPEHNVCLLGNRKCDPTQPCNAHERWQRMARPVGAFFSQTTLSQMLDPIETEVFHLLEAS